MELTQSLKTVKLKHCAIGAFLFIVFLIASAIPYLAVAVYRGATGSWLNLIELLENGHVLVLSATFFGSVFYYIMRQTRSTEKLAFFKVVGFVVCMVGLLICGMAFAGVADHHNITDLVALERGRGFVKLWLLVLLISSSVFAWFAIVLDEAISDEKGARRIVEDTEEENIKAITEKLSDEHNEDG
jgi:purine-cytosine permease-like protein